MRLGRLQKHMLNFIKRNTRHPNQLFSIARDATTRRVAKSLERKGLIKIVNPHWECWSIRLAN